MSALASIDCPLCGSAAAQPAEFGNVARIDCPQCGPFRISGSLQVTVSNYDLFLRKRVGFWVTDQIALGDAPTVLSYTFDQVAQLREMTLAERLERLLRWAAEKQRRLGNRFALNERVVSWTHSENTSDVRMLAEVLHKKGWLREPLASGVGQVSFAGFEHLAEAPVASTHNVFIAMWFDPSMADARTSGLMRGVSGAGYQPVLVNDVEHTGKIDDEIVSQIRRSRMLVADFTGHRGGVYFEAGFAMGLGLPILWTCKQSDISHLHFDVRQYNCIDWTTPDELAVRLQRRIEAVVGRGPL